MVNIKEKSERYMRIGFGYDVHKFIEDRPLILEA